MSLMIEELYDAFIEAGASEEKARAAAKAVAMFENRFLEIDRHFAQIESTQRLHGWMLATLITITLLSLGGTMAVLFRLTGQ